LHNKQVEKAFAALDETDLKFSTRISPQNPSELLHQWSFPFNPTPQWQRRERKKNVAQAQMSNCLFHYNANSRISDGNKNIFFSFSIRAARK
jgi:hypothetical protein